MMVPFAKVRPHQLIRSDKPAVLLITKERDSENLRSVCLVCSSK